jgi:hypothetical protein
LAHLIFRCQQANRVITTGIEIDPEVFRSLRTAREMRCQFCGQDHKWEAVERIPEVFALMSLRAEEFLGRSVESEAYAANAADPGVRSLYERLAGQWFRLAIHHEDQANGISQPVGEGQPR